VPGKQCGANEAFNDQPFFLTTDRNDFTFIGDYFVLATRQSGVLWAAYGDTRDSDVSHAFVARGRF
jgi:hypothetical protein